MPSPPHVRTTPQNGPSGAPFCADSKVGAQAAPSPAHDGGEPPQAARGEPRHPRHACRRAWLLSWSRVAMPTAARSRAVKQQSSKRAPMGEECGQSKEASTVHLSAPLASLGVSTIAASPNRWSASARRSRCAVKPAREDETVLPSPRGKFSRHGREQRAGAAGRCSRSLEIPLPCSS